MRFFFFFFPKKKPQKKRKNIPQKGKTTKKVFHGRVAVLSLLYFSCLKTPCQCATLIFFFFFSPFSFCMAVNKLLFSIWWFPCRCCSVQVKHRMFSFNIFFFFKCFVFLKVQSMWCMRWDGKLSWSGAFMPSEGEFLSFIFLCVRVGNNLYFIFCSD